MESTYANRFRISVFGDEVHLYFFTETPVYDENGKYKENRTIKENLIIMSKDGYQSFREMLEEAEKTKEGEDE